MAEIDILEAVTCTTGKWWQGECRKNHYDFRSLHEDVCVRIETEKKYYSSLFQQKSANLNEIKALIR